MTGEARAQLGTTLVFIGAALLVAGQTPVWTLAIALACAVWRLLIATGRLPAPKPRKGLRFIFGVVTALLVGGVLLSFQTLNGLAAGTALLTLMGALKLLESRSRRDDAIAIGVSLFLLLAAGLGDQGLLRLPLYLLVLWSACAALMIVAHADSQLPVSAALRLSARALLMAAPLAAACFLFFPRFSGQFWALPRGGEASTGLSDQMSPGAIDKLVADYEPAFRVRFEGAPPPPQARYWRGPVLNSFDGFTWRRIPRNYLAADIEFLGEPVRYRVTLEPTFRNWIFTLDTVLERPERGMSLSHDRLITRSEPVYETISYNAVSHLETRALEPLSTLGRRYETDLPPNRNPRALALARQLRDSVASDEEYSRRVLDWFMENGLEYTLEPDPTSVESVDSVLFDTKRGFCGHFASAYATLMRAVGIPARVVTGYLGGEFNPTGGYFIVRQSDAHAWTEIWIEGRGWTRVDPTAVVEPDRLRTNVYDVLGEANEPLELTLQRTEWIGRLARSWDGANQWWREQIVEFNQRSQLGFLHRLGIDAPDWRHLGWGFVGALLTWLLWVAFTFRRSVARPKPDRIARAWLRATKKLERVAPPREPHEAALHYAARVAAQHPPIAGQVRSLAERYTALRFGPEASAAEVAELEREVRQLTV